MRVVLPGAIIALVFLFHGCMTFRSTHAELHDFFRKEGVPMFIRQYKVGKRTMEYIHTGDSTKPLLLFLHGSPGSLDAFVSYLADSTLLTECFLISADRPGFGNSNFGFAEPSLKKQSDILVHILQQHKNSRPIILIGHSLGGPLIARMAIDYPHLVDGLAIVSGSVDPDLEPNEMWFRAPLATPFLSWILPKSFRTSNDELYQLKPQLIEMTPDWKKITCPVMIVHGKKDGMVDYGNVAFLKKNLVNASVDSIVFEEAGHFIPWQKEKEIIAAILKLVETAKKEERGNRQGKVEY